MLSLLLLVLAQADAGTLLRDCGRGEGPALAPLIAQTLGIVDFQRTDYATQLLDERGLSPTACPALLRAVTPKRIMALSGPISVEWDVTDEALCFQTVRVTSKGVTSVLELNDVHCADREPQVQFEDFDFDGKPDLRLVTRITFMQSRRFDVVLLQRAGNRYEFSLPLTQLDDLQRDPKKQQLTSRRVEAERARWKWKSGALVPAK